MDAVASSKTKMRGSASTALTNEMSCFFAGGQLVSALADVAVVAVFHVHDGVMCTDELCSGLNLLVRRV